MFPRLKQFINDDTQISGDVIICILSHLCSLKSHFGNYVPDLEMENCEWFRDHFNAHLKGTTLAITN